MPAPSKLHEEIENDVMEAITSKAYQVLGSPFDEGGISFTLDHAIAKQFYSFHDSKRCFPDFYLNLNDGRGLIQQMEVCIR